MDAVRYRPGELLLAAHRRRGPVLRFGPYTYLLGPEANRFVLGNSDLFRWREAFQSLVPVDGPTSLIVSDGEDHARRRRLVQPALHHRRIDQYLSIMVEHADATLATWRPGQVVDVYRQFRSVIRRGTIHALFGRRLAGDEAFFGEQLQVLLDLVDRLPASVTWARRLRTPGWRRAMAARGRVDERVHAEIDRVRSGVLDEDDHVLATLVRGRDDDGAGLSDEEVRDQVVSLIAAGYETTSAAMAWAVHLMLCTPGSWERARAEVVEVVGDRAPVKEDLRRLTYLNGVVHEALRLCPPAVVVPRWAVEDFTFDGRRIRAGTTVLYSPYVTHRLPEVWPEPLRFRPERWDPARADHRKPGPHEFLPFGGGPHRCVGSVLATTELTVMLARLVVRTSLRSAPGRPRPTSLAAMRPRDGLPALVSAPRPAGHPAR
ncbi:cytochrome P450 [Saccharothrix sp. NRRL B-16348]|uniref:cytochrome P450 n=1 Tax=Saccharothrix sp. NRRL B-16348 TaxID=1415542 RepID=UPI0006AF5921|nr:cytochrome P450 [Saccharothrix sp. NRRL B-16348]KOX22495.1 cytochrome P450 [Saccharothrix sp. NRRL B-16348]